MEELVRFIVLSLAQNKEKVSVTLEDDKILVVVSKDDMGKVIGKQGKIAKSIRTLVKAASAKENKKYLVEISEIE